MKHYLAFDLGASSGRAILGTLAEGRLELKELHRFANGPVDIDGGLYWNLLGLFAEMKTGLAKAVEMGVELDGIAIDTWGVDFAFLDAHGKFAGVPRNYRDPRTSDILPWAFERVSREEIYDKTGIQFMNFNTLFQLAAMVRDQDPALTIARNLLFIPNALTYLFCGDVSAEYTIATTSQAYDPKAEDWAWELLDALEIPRKVMPRIVPPCTVVGALRPAICEELNCSSVPVILVGSHDTASAVAAVPADESRSWAFLSSGTWSLLGVELPAPLISPEALRLNYTNEGGLAGRIRFLKNIMGLWLIQECRHEWQRQGLIFTFDEMDDMATEAEPFRSLIDPNADVFIAPGNMPDRIAAFCRETGQPVPETPGQIMRCALDSLALRYRLALDEIETITGTPIEVLHLVGGGSKNVILTQFTANAVQRPVIAGPVEATAIGNLVAQALATGDLGSLEEARQVVKRSSNTRTYTPEETPLWQQGYDKYRQLFR